MSGLHLLGQLTKTVPVLWSNAFLSKYYPGKFHTPIFINIHLRLLWPSINFLQKMETKRRQSLKNGGDAKRKRKQSLKKKTNLTKPGSSDPRKEMFELLRARTEFSEVQLIEVHKWQKSRDNPMTKWRKSVIVTRRPLSKSWQFLKLCNFF